MNNLSARPLTPKVWTIPSNPLQQRRSDLLNGLIQRAGVMAEQRKPKLVEQFVSEPGHVREDEEKFSLVLPQTVRTLNDVGEWLIRQTLRFGGLPLDEIVPLINRDTAAMAFSLATGSMTHFMTQRLDVVLHTIPFLDNPEQLLGDRCVLADPECFDALLARLTPEVLNADSSDGSWKMAHWENAIQGHGVGQEHTEEHYLNVILPRLHAAGADLMDDRFEGIIPQERQPFAPDLTNGRIALATYRRQVLAAELHAIADAEATTTVQPRNRRRL